MMRAEGGSRSLNSQGSRTFTPPTPSGDGSTSSQHEFEEKEEAAAAVEKQQQPLLEAGAAATQEEEKEEKFELKLEEISELKVSPRTWKYNSEEKEPEKKWVYEEPAKFSAARRTLGYDKQERANLQPADLLQSYLPKEAPEEKKPEESDFDYQIRIRNHVATSLKDNMVYPISFRGLFTQVRNHGRAERLVLLEEMLAVFNNTLTNALFNKEDIEKMSKELSVKLDMQKEFFGGPFNSQLKL